MPTKVVYLSDEDMQVWEAAAKLAKTGRMSMSKLIVSELKTWVRQRTGAAAAGLPVGFRIPASMKDPREIQREAALARIATFIETELVELDEKPEPES